MKSALRNMVALGAFAALAAASNAAIVINIPTGDGGTTGTGTAEILRPALSDYSVFVGSGGTVSGSFTFMSTIESIVKIDAQVKTNSLSYGKLSFDANVTGVATPILHREAEEHDGDYAAMSTAYQTTTVSLAPNTWYTMNWTANFLGDFPDPTMCGAALQQADFVFTEDSQPVPEPTSILAIGVGLTGVFARRRKAGK